MKPKYEIINHGPDHEQYFQGCGTAFSDFDRVVTGAGYDAVEAYNDAVDQIYQSEATESEIDRLHLPSRPRGYGITLKNHVPARSEDWYWYVSIRYSQGS
jgi:hypothetical protein